MDQPVEIISGQRLVGMLQGLIDSHRICKMEVPESSFPWVTSLLGLQQVDHEGCLLINRVVGFEKAVSSPARHEVSIEFLERDGIPFQFKTRIIDSLPGAIRLEFPRLIYRVQRRVFFRVKALPGTEVLFHVVPGEKAEAEVQDYSLGGMAFFVEKNLVLHIGDQITDICLRLPQEKEGVSYDIPLAWVRRIEQTSKGKDLCILEFLGLPNSTRERLWHHIFKEQKMLLKKTKKI
jgi:c-di-GMP-binding flagellar brake protein YcgR